MEDKEKFIKFTFPLYQLDVVKKSLKKCLEIEFLQDIDKKVAEILLEEINKIEEKDARENYLDLENIERGNRK